MDEMDRPAETPAAVSSEAGPAEPGNGAAPALEAPEVDEAPLDAAELEVMEAGEPIPLLLRESIPLETAVLSNDVLVPEAAEEVPPSPFLEISTDGAAPDGDLLPITPE